MKLSAKPISSPGRTEKFPPPLMRFLRANTGSKSNRVRSRSSPMFIVRKRTNNAIEATTTTAQEPSSPKVTCMGQVRVKRSKPRKNNHRKKPKKAFPACRCQWMFPRALFLRPKISRPLLSKWASFFQLSFRRKVDTKEESKKTNNNKIESRIEVEEEEEEDSEESEREEEDCEKVFMAASSPPKNALLLTRCRSAPYRSSSLARRFWESPLKNEDEEEKQSTEIENRADENDTEKETDEKTSNKDDEEEEAKKTKEESEELGLRLGFAVLTRCKSEPARTGENKLGVEPEFGFWRNDNDIFRRRRRRRFGVVDSLSPSVL